MNYALTATVARTFEDALATTRARLADEGFGVLTEIDVAATLKAKIDAVIPPQVILGACRPALAYTALQAEPSIGLLLPCNVVVRAVDEGHTLVEAMDPAVMVQVTKNENLVDVAAEARERLSRAVSAVGDATSGEPTG